MGSKKKITVGFHYYMGMHMGLGRGPVNEIVEIQAGDKTAWSGSLASSQRITINQPNLFGGEKREGGIAGTLDVMMGEPAQVAPAKLAGMLGGDVPGFRGFVGLFFDGMVSAMNPYIKPWKVRVRRTTAGWDGEAWYSAKAKIELSGGSIHAMNPAHIVYECLTNRDWGGGMDRSRLDDASFRAAADQLYGEGFGLCLRWNRGDSVSDFVEDVLDHVGGNLYLSRFDGLFHLTLIRDDYTVESLPLFDEDSGLLGVDEDDNAATAGALNEIVVKWHDPISNEARSWRERNLGAVRADGQVLSETKSYSGLPTADLAGRVAVRELRAASSGLKRFKVRLDRRGYGIEPGQPFRIRSLKRGIETMVVRAGRIEDGRLDDATITITAVQDVFGLPASSMAAVQPSGWVPPDSTPAAVTEWIADSMSWRDLVQVTDPASLALIDGTSGYLTTVAVKPTSLSMGYGMELRAGAAAWGEADPGDFCPSGLLVSAVGAADASFQLAAGSDLDFAMPGGAALLGGEVVRIDAFDAETGIGTMGRGCVDTVPSSHAAGTRMWFYEGYGSVSSTEYTAGTSLQARLRTQTSSGILSEDLATAITAYVGNRLALPYAPGKFAINAASYPSVATGTVVVTWAHRDRLLQADQLIDTLQGSIGPESGTTYEVALKRADTGAVIASKVTARAGANLSTEYAGAVTVSLSSLRDGLYSRATHVHTLTHANPAPPVPVEGDDPLPEGWVQPPIIPLPPAIPGTYVAPAAVGAVYGGGRYVGTYEYPDGINYHLVLADISGEAGEEVWSEYVDPSGMEDDYHGATNQSTALTGDHSEDFVMFWRAATYGGGGVSGWYVPAKEELRAIWAALAPANTTLAAFKSGGAQAFSEIYAYASSTEAGPTTATYFAKWFRSNGWESVRNKSTEVARCRPVRRVPA